VFPVRPDFASAAPITNFVLLKGVALPFGQVKLGIDTSVLNLDQGGISSANSGYTPRGNATGFSLLHTSGTGGRAYDPWARPYGDLHHL
jgi:putative alpha-1,2-mannosidase